MSLLMDTEKMLYVGEFKHEVRQFEKSYDNQQIGMLKKLKSVNSARFLFIQILVIISLNMMKK